MNRSQGLCWRGCIVACALMAAACTKPEVAKQQHLEKGKHLAAQQQYPAAILEFRNAIKIDPLFGEARFELAEALSHITTEATPEALAEMVGQYGAAAELMPTNTDAQVKAAAVLLTVGDMERARKHAAAALKVNPKNADAQTIFAMSLAGMKDLDGALKEMHQAVTIDPSNYRPFVNLGTLEATAGHAEEAEAAFKQGVALSPQSAQANTALGYFYWAQNRPAEAEQALKAGAAIVPYDRTANSYLAMFYTMHDRAADAETPLLRMVNQKVPEAVLMLGDLYVTQRRLDKARPLYDSLKNDRLMRAQAIRRLATLDYDTGKPQQAQAAVDEVLKEQPNNVDLLVLKTSWAVREHRVDDALQLATRGVKAAPQSAAAQYWLGVAYTSRRQNTEAIAAFRETLRLNPKVVDAQVQLSRLLLTEGDATESLSYAESARKERHTLDTHTTVVAALLAKNDLNRADAELTPLLKQFPDAASVHALRGQLLSARSDHVGATREFDRALELDSTNLQALAGRVRLDLQQKRIPEARARLAKAVASQPKNSPLLILAASFEQAAGDTAAAEQYLRKSLDADPTNLAAYDMLGRIYMAQHRLDAARAEYERIASQHPDNVAAKTMVGIIFDAQQRPDDAIKVYQDVVKRSPRAAVASNNLAYYYAVRNADLPTALQLAQTAKQQMPDSPEVDDTLGFVYFKQGLYEQALQALERCVEKEPRNPGYQYHLGLAYAKNGEKDKARQSLQKALSLEPTFDGAPDAQAVLNSLGR